MKTFEEKWTAWIDDQLTGRELRGIPGLALRIGLRLKRKSRARNKSVPFCALLFRFSRSPIREQAEFLSSRPVGWSSVGCVAPQNVFIGGSSAKVLFCARNVATSVPMGLTERSAIFVMTVMSDSLIQITARCSGEVRNRLIDRCSRFARSKQWEQ